MAPARGVRRPGLSQLPCGPLGYLISPNNFRDPEPGNARRGAARWTRREAPAAGRGGRQPGREGPAAGRVTLPLESSDGRKSIVA